MGILRGFGAVLGICLVALAAIWGGPANSTPEPKRVLILQSVGREFKPWSTYADAIRAELGRQAPWPLDVQEHSLVPARYADIDPETPFVAYLQSLYAKHPPDVILCVGAPSAAFVQRHRQQLFPKAPVVLTTVEARRVQYSNLTENDAVVAVTHRFLVLFESFLRISPETKTIAIVLGDSPNERFWSGEIKRELQPLEGRVEIRWYNKLSFEEMLAQFATLPQHSAIFWYQMVVDAAGAAHEGDRAFARLYQVANAPIFTHDDSFFGREVVGGPMHSARVVSRASVAVAVRILNGEKPGDIKVPPSDFSPAKYDWRELKRWGIDESRLPPDSEVYFREQTVWESYRWPVVLTASVIFLQATLISVLLHEHRRRRRAEVEARQRLTELAHVNRYLAAGELTTSIAHELSQPLGSILTNAETAELMLKSAAPDVGELREILADIRRDDQRASEVIRRLRSMLKRTPFEVREIDLNEIVGEVVGFLTDVASGRDIGLIYLPHATALRSKGDAIQLQQVVLNLIMNAMAAITEAGSAKREVVVLTNKVGSEAEILVRDSGPGIAADHLEEVFNPFFTTKADGMGMGLAIARTIVEAHHGRIGAENASWGGAVFRIKLPLVRAS